MNGCQICKEEGGGKIMDYKKKQKIKESEG